MHPSSPASRYRGWKDAAMGTMGRWSCGKVGRAGPGSGGRMYVRTPTYMHTYIHAGVFGDLQRCRGARASTQFNSSCDVVHRAPEERRIQATRSVLGGSSGIHALVHESESRPSHSRYTAHSIDALTAPASLHRMSSQLGPEETLLPFLATRTVCVCLVHHNSADAFSNFLGDCKCTESSSGASRKIG